MHQSDFIEAGKNEISQDSQGILKNSNTAGQDSPGILTDTSSPKQVDREYAYLPPSEIEEFRALDDYIEFTISPHPLIAKSPTRSYCIDGYNLVQEAIKKNDPEIRCHIFHVVDDSKIEIALMKAAARLVSDQEQPSFSELMRICIKLADLLQKTTDNPIRYSHGGARKGIHYNTNNREDNIRNLLAERLGRSVETINKYLNYGEYLNDSFVDIVVRKKQSKDFFEKVASNKRRFIKNLKSDGIVDQAIIEQISQKMPEWLKEYDDTEKIEPLRMTPQISVNQSILPNPPSNFEHHGECSSEKDQLSVEDVRGKIKEICISLTAAASNENFNCTEFIPVVREAVVEILKELRLLENISKQVSDNEKMEVA